VSDGARAVTYAVRFRVLARYLGQLGIVLAAMTVVPALAALVLGDTRFAMRFGVAAVGLAAVGVPLARLRARGRLQTNEALAISALAFLLLPLAMIYPMSAGGLSGADALFESVSAVTTTGLTVVRAEEQSHAFLFARAWMQWYGGLGIVVLWVALVTRPGLVAKQLGDRPDADRDLAGSTRTRARTVLLVYGALSVAGIILVLLAGAGVFSGVVHVLSAVSTGGFSSYDASLAGFAGWAPRIVVLGVCVAGAVPLTLYRSAVTRGWRRLLLNPQVLALGGFSILAAAALATTLHAVGRMPWTAALVRGSTTAVSAQTTAGFSAADVSAFDPASKLVLLAAMFVGGSLGSSAGGVKLVRVIILLRVVQAAVRRTCLPRHAVHEPRIAGARLGDAETRDALLLILLTAAVVAGSWFVFAALGYDALDALFDVVSATGTVGLSSGVTHASLPFALKLVLCADMLAGRVEILAFLVLFYPPTWFGKRLEML